MLLATFFSRSRKRSSDLVIFRAAVTPRFNQTWWCFACKMMIKQDVKFRKNPRNGLVNTWNLKLLNRKWSANGFNDPSSDGFSKFFKLSQMDGVCQLNWTSEANSCFFLFMFCPSKQLAALRSANLGTSLRFRSLQGQNVPQILEAQPLAEAEEEWLRCQRTWSFYPLPSDPNFWSGRMWDDDFVQMMVDELILHFDIL